MTGPSGYIPPSRGCRCKGAKSYEPLACRPEVGGPSGYHGEKEWHSPQIARHHKKSCKWCFYMRGLAAPERSQFPETRRCASSKTVWNYTTLDATCSAFYSTATHYGRLAIFFAVSLAFFVSLTVAALLWD